MRSRSIRLALSIVGLVFLLSACRSPEPIFNVRSHPLASPIVPLAKRDEQIRRAGVGLGWVMNDVSPGRIQAILNIRTHQAIADITFTPTEFSIAYRASSNLDYDGYNIHPNYNGWIENLEKAISIQSSF